MKQHSTFALYAFILSLLLGGCKTGSETSEDWAIISFVKQDAVNPIMGPRDDTWFFCPIGKDSVLWEEKDVFNPSAVLKDGKIYLIYRAEDVVGKYLGTSRIGIAVSEDGINFERHPVPVLYPDEDFMKEFEWEGGVEDPRVVLDEFGDYYMTYSSYDGDKARLCLASSADLYNWQKHGLVLGVGKYRDVWSKSGAVITKQVGNEFIAEKVNGKYWMLFGDTDIFIAWSENMIDWIPVEVEEPYSGRMMPGTEYLYRVFRPRDGNFDSDLVESGPQIISTENGHVMIYNSKNLNDPTYPVGTYAAGQVLLDLKDPKKVVSRLEKDFFHPEKDYEITGQVNNVCFVEGLVYHQEKYFLYYGTADSKIAVAIQE
ncbi:glycoside hydrolase family 130 protein [Bacteroidota bacterium]